jgi:putative aldouronate transport system substrate-binding protein
MLQGTGLAVAGLGLAASSSFASPAVLKHGSSRAQSGETLKVSWATWVQGPVDENNAARDLILERFNIDLEMLAFERATWFDQLNTRVGGGDVPDIIYRDSGGVLSEYADQGVLREVPYDAIKSSAPEAFAAANEFTSDVWLAAYFEGANYGYPFQQPLQMKPWTNGWRLDWLETLGLEAPKTMDEYGEAYRRIYSDDPGATGLSYGLGLRGKDSITNTIHSFCMGFGANPAQWMQLEDGTMQHGVSMDGTRQGLEVLSGWFNEGLIDPEFLTVDGTVLNQRFASGLFGMIPGTWYTYVPGMVVFDGLRAVNPEATMVGSDAPAGPDGQFGYMNWGPITSSLAFGAHVDDAKLERILEMVNAIQTDQELAVQLRRGTEGETWGRDPESNGAVWLGDYVNPANRGPLGSNFFDAASPSPVIQAFLGRDDEDILSAHATAGNVKNFLPFATMLVPSDVSAQATEEQPIRERWLSSFIAGTESLDNWDSFIEEWSNAGGGTAMTEAVNATVPELQSIRDQIAAAVGVTPEGEATPTS